MDNARESSLWSQKDFQQAQIYAQELHELYQVEHKRREELAEEKLVLEHKLRELAALNTLFQSHLQERKRIEEAYWELLEGLKKLLSDKAPQNWEEKVKRLVANAETRLSQPQT